MPPHCDSMDGPVVKAAMRGIVERDVDLVLPYVPESAEEEVRAAFERVQAIRGVSHDVREVADVWFYETVVRLHRLGEGAPYSGLKPAGLDHGPVVPVAERAIEDGDPSELAHVLHDLVDAQVGRRLAEVLGAKHDLHHNVAAQRRYVEAALGLQVWSHSLYEAALAHPHEHEHAHV